MHDSTSEQPDRSHSMGKIQLVAEVHTLLPISLGFAKIGDNPCDETISSRL